MTEDEQIGYNLGLQDLRYTQIPDAIGGDVSAGVYRGFDKAMSETKCNYLNKHWNKSWGYKTTSKPDTLFT